jgi:DNA 3'-phosphatase
MKGKTLQNSELAECFDSWDLMLLMLRYAVTILSNQNGLKSPAKVESFKRKIANILSQVGIFDVFFACITTLFEIFPYTIFFQLSIPIRLIAAMKKDIYRKPATGMWDLLQKEINGKIGKGRNTQCLTTVSSSITNSIPKRFRREFLYRRCSR